MVLAHVVLHTDSSGQLMARQWPSLGEVATRSVHSIQYMYVQGHPSHNVYVICCAVFLF